MNSEISTAKRKHLVNRFDNGLRWLFIVPLLLIQVCQVGGQGVESRTGKNVPDQLNMCFELAAPVIIDFDGGINANTDDGWPSFRGGNVSFPMFQESDEGSLSGILITSNGKAMPKQGTDEYADKGTDRVCHWATHISFFLICLWLGIWIGYYKRLLPPIKK
jgi:hypothetical protein